MFVDDHGPGPPTENCKLVYFSKKYTPNNALLTKTNNVSPVTFSLTNKQTNDNMMFKNAAKSLSITADNQANHDIDMHFDISHRAFPLLKLVNHTTNNKGTEEKDWTLVQNSKKQNTEGTQLEEGGTNEPDATHQTKYRYPININIKGKASGSKFYSNKILRDFLDNVKKIDSEAGIGEVNITSNDALIINDIISIPTDANVINKFIETPSIVKNGFKARIFIHLNKTFKELKTDSTFTNWLKEEHMSIKINELSTTNQAKVGFISKHVPRHDFIKVFEARLKKSLPRAAPTFQIIIETIYIQHSQARVLMIVADNENVKQLQGLLKIAPMESKFYSWNDYLGLKPDQRRTIIKEEIKFNMTNRSLFLEGFTENNPTMLLPHIVKDNDMEQDDEQNPKNDDEWDSDYIYIDQNGNPSNKINLETTTITSYICQHFKAGDETPLFQKVYAPAAGIIEFVIDKYHRNEAIALLHVLHGQLARSMNSKSIQEAFINPDNAILQASGDSYWAPNALSSAIAPSATTPPTTNSNRKRKSTKQHHRSNSTYAAVLNFDDEQMLQPTRRNYPSKPRERSINSTTTTIQSAQSTLTQNTELNEQYNNEIWQAIKVIQNDTKEIKLDHDAIFTKVEEITNVAHKQLFASTIEVFQKYDDNFVELWKSQKHTEQKMFTSIQNLEDNVQSEMKELRELSKDNILACKLTSDNNTKLDYKLDLLLKHCKITDDSDKENTQNKRKIVPDDSMEITTTHHSSSHQMINIEGRNDGSLRNEKFLIDTSYGKEHKPVAAKS